MTVLKKLALLLVIICINAPSAHAVQSMLPIPEGHSYEDEEIDILPTAVLRIRNNTRNNDNLSGTTATVFTFSGNGSYDGETSARYLEVRFDFENDGEVDTYFSQTKYEKYTYKTPGWKTVKMEVLDLTGNISSTTEKIYIVKNTPPKAHFTISPKIGTLGTVFRFNTSQSSDDQYKKGLLGYRFDFDGDGKFDTKFSSKTTWNHKFPKTGLKNVKVEVRDPEGALATYSEMVLIKPNKPPVASFKSEIIRQNDEYVRMQLDASESFDPENKKMKYKWDLNYNGKNDIQWNTPWYSSSKTFANFYKSGEYVIRLLIRDKDGATDEIFKKVVVNLLSN
jgi:PKD repeat protein